VKAVEGMTISHAKEQIRAALVFDVLDTSSNKSGPSPVLGHIRALANAAVFTERKDVRDNPRSKSGKSVSVQPVAVKNAGQVRKIWAKVQKEYEDQRKRDESAGKPPRKLTASFIIDRLPNDFKPQHILGIRNANTATRLTRVMRLCQRRNPVPPRSPAASIARPTRRPVSSGGLAGSPRIAGGFVPVRGRDHPMVDRERSADRRVPRRNSGRADRGDRP
jgi:hypothetical protein